MSIKTNGVYMIENKKFKRIFLIVIDSLGVGYDDKAKDFGDEGADTFGHIVSQYNDIKIDVLESFGLFNLDNVEASKNRSVSNVKSYCCRLREKSNAKSTMEGHFEMM